MQQVIGRGSFGAWAYSRGHGWGGEVIGDKGGEAARADLRVLFCKGGQAIGLPGRV